MTPKPLQTNALDKNLQFLKGRFGQALAKNLEVLQLEKGYQQRIDPSLLRDAFVKDPKQIKALGIAKYNIVLKDLLPFVNEDLTIKLMVKRRTEHEAKMKRFDQDNLTYNLLFPEEELE